MKTMKYYRLGNDSNFQWWNDNNPYVNDCIYPENFKFITSYSSRTIEEMAKLSPVFQEVTELEFKNFLKSKHNFIFDISGKPLKDCWVLL